ASGDVDQIDFKKLDRLAQVLGLPKKDFAGANGRKAVRTLLEQYGFQATKYILNKAREFASSRGKKLMVVLFDPDVTVSLVKTGKRYDQEIADFLAAEKFDHFDMNLVHLRDFQDFRVPLEDYLKRYLIGHYSPAGNHFFAYAIKP